MTAFQTEQTMWMPMPRSRARRFGLALASAAALSGCADISHQAVRGDEAVQVIGPAVRDNRTPLELAYRCYGRALKRSLEGPLSIAVGAITDYTGRTNDVEGAAITQGGSLMIFSALDKLDGAVLVHDRFDTRVTELELAYMDKRRLGDGRIRQVDGQNVPWLPYYGGTIAQSDFFMVGGITELNYNIQSGGAELRISQVGPKARTYTMSIAVDLRLVNTRSLVVESAVSVQKQLVGYEIGFETFRFLDIAGGPELLDINIGTKSQEPLQLGVRATLEAAVLELLADLTTVSHKPCLPELWRLPEDEDLDPPVAAAAAAPTAPASAARVPTEIEPVAADPEPMSEEPVAESVVAAPAAPAEAHAAEVADDGDAALPRDPVAYSSAPREAPQPLSEPPAEATEAAAATAAAAADAILPMATTAAAPETAEAADAPETGAADASVLTGAPKINLF